jgi:aspartyl-tRNA synthetase
MRSRKWRSRLGRRECHYLAITAEGVKGSAAKFVKEEELAALKSKTGAGVGDLIVFASDARAVVNKLSAGCACGSAISWIWQINP